MKDLKIFNKILGLKTLKPSKETNRAFSELVKFGENSFNEISLKDEEILKLRKLSCEAEYEMELFWADKIIHSKNPSKELENFWYYKNYQDLATLEYLNVFNINNKIKKVLFIGGGPLPLTAIILAIKFNLKCSVLEKDEKSFLKAKEVVSKLNLDKKIKIINIDANKYEKYTNYDVLYLAALVGENEISKNKVINYTYKQIKSNALFLCRSSHGSRKVMYSPINKNIFKKLNPVLEVRPHNSVINSFFILQKI